MATLARNWWLLVLRGIAAVLFGVLALLWPGATLASLVLLFGIYSLVEGVTSLVLAFMRAEGRTGTWVLHALVGIGAGILTFVYPGITAIALYAIIAGWAIATGIVEIFVASELRDAGGDVGTVVFAGILSILFGTLLIALPAVGVMALVGTIAAFAFLSGIAWVTFGVRLHSVVAAR
jgi:uncharacterized membrane protein HdeD (DUF308 family)